MAYKGWDLETSWFWENIKGWWLLLQMRLRDDDLLLYEIAHNKRQNFSKKLWKLENIQKIKGWGRDTTSQKSRKIKGFN